MKQEINREWVLTDSRTNQYGRQLTHFLFEFKEDGKEQTLIDITGYRRKTIEDCINSFGYTMFNSEVAGNQNIYDVCDNPDWIIAECLFELDVIEK